MTVISLLDSVYIIDPPFGEERKTPKRRRKRPALVISRTSFNAEAQKPARILRSLT
jgi:hypothetical protein